MRARRILSIAAVIALVVCLAGCALQDMPAAAIAATSAAKKTTAVETAAAVDTQNVISVSGSGKTTVKPDVAYLTVGVKTTNQKASAAIKQNAEKMNAVIAALKALGIKTEEVKTTDYYINTQYDYSQNPQKFTGYEVTNLVNVTINDIEKVGDIIDAVSQEGANEINNISFDLKNRNDAYNTALKNAVDNAKSHADALAQSAGVKLGKAVRIAEEGSPQYYENYVGVRMEAASADMGSTPIQTGTMDISVTVNVDYVLE